MIPTIPEQRKFKANKGKPFNDLLRYIEAQLNQSVGLRKQLGSDFSSVIDYVTAPTDQGSGVEKCIAIRTHGVAGIATASLEMNTVAQKNTRCPDPVYHIILSWPEHEKPAPELIFDAAEHALRTLGLGKHQYVLAVHGNTDNMHCHISVNRIHPQTFKSHNIAWSHKNLHRAARESEIKHGWSHDKGLFVVEIDAKGKKQVVPNLDHADASRTAAPRVHPELGSDELLPVWHDPQSLDSWLKTTVAKALSPALKTLDGWTALHAWLSDFDITLQDTGGGGMRLRATSAETGEVLDLAASKGLRMLKRGELEKRWGPFFNGVDVVCQASDFSHLSQQQLPKGGAAVLALAQRPPEHFLLRPQKGIERADPLLPTPLRQEITTSDRGPDPMSREPRDAAQRTERKAQRAAERLELRQRFAQHQNSVRQADALHFPRVKELQAERSLALSELRAQSSLEVRAVRKTIGLIQDRFMPIVAINNANLGRKLQIEANFQEKAQALRAVRAPPLSWRAWLLQQAGQGDQAALSALRGIVYQAQRDAKRDAVLEESESADDLEGTAYRARHFKKLMTRLLDEEQKEAAIRCADIHRMRPYQADALLRLYAEMVWHVTANGNVEYRDTAGAHLFTDRGNRVTFDRVRVEDDEIRLALAHAQQKFGMPLTLTGNDPVFTERMARLADDMGIAILNPELQAVIERHRLARKIPTSVLPEPVARPPLPEFRDEVLSELLPEQSTSVVSARIPVPTQAKQAALVPEKTLPEAAAESDLSSRAKRSHTAFRQQRSAQARSPVEPVEQTVTDNMVDTAKVEHLVQLDASSDSPERKRLAAHILNSV